MANSLISMIKGNSTLINNTEVLNGQVLFDTDKKAILLDDNNTRSEYCGADKSNKNLAPIENGNTATRGYSAGSYVVWKEQLYKVLTQINSGTAFVVGTNIALDTVGAELTQISADLGSINTLVENNIIVGISYTANNITVPSNGTKDVIYTLPNSYITDGYSILFGYVTNTGWGGLISQGCTIFNDSHSITFVIYNANDVERTVNIATAIWIQHK